MIGSLAGSLVGSRGEESHFGKAERKSSIASPMSGWGEGSNTARRAVSLKIISQIFRWDKSRLAPKRDIIFMLLVSFPCVETRDKTKETKNSTISGEEQKHHMD